MMTTNWSVLRWATRGDFRRSYKRHANRFAVLEAFRTMIFGARLKAKPNSRRPRKTTWHKIATHRPVPVVAVQPAHAPDAAARRQDRSHFESCVHSIAFPIYLCGAGDGH